MNDDPEERVRVIAELRAAASELLTELGDRGEALLVLVSCVVVVQGRHADLATSMDVVNRGDCDEHVLRLIYAPSHESIHMVQMLTSRVVLQMAFELFNLSSVTNARRRAGEPEADWLPELLRSYRALQRSLSEAPDNGFSTLQVMETQAVLEGFRGGFSRHVRGGLLLILHLAHGDAPIYTELIASFDAAHGFELTFAVLSRLCWLALEADDPGSWMTQALGALSTDNLRQIAALSAADTCRAFGRDPAQAGRSWRLRRPAIARHPLHGLLGRYFDVIERETDAETFLQRAMHPGRSQVGARVSTTELMPPLSIFSDEVYLLNGPYAGHGWAVAEPLLRISAQSVRTLAWLDARSRESL